MRKNYVAPELFVDEYVADTMIASYGTFNTQTGYPKNGNAANKHNCWSLRDVPGAPSPDDPTNACYTLTPA